MPVRFDCHSCGQPWWAPPGNGCPRCGYGAVGTPDPIIWGHGQVPGTSIFVSAQMRDADRFAGFVRQGIGTFVDVAGDNSYVWRPDDEAIRAAGVAYARIPLEDTNVDLPDSAFSAVEQALGAAQGSVLLFCAAGLKRAPHLLYGVLRARGHEPEDAWSRVASARPMTETLDRRFPTNARASTSARLRPSAGSPIGMSTPIALASPSAAMSSPKSRKSRAPSKPVSLRTTAIQPRKAASTPTTVTQALSS